MTIEELIVAKYGITSDPVLGVWMLRDGRLVNGSYEGHQRDVDHHEVSYYFKPSVHARPGSCYTYVQKFMNRGNIRWGCSEFGFCIEYNKTPSEDQFRNIFKYLYAAEQAGIDTLVTHRTPWSHGRDGRTLRLPLTLWLYHLASSTSNLKDLANKTLIEQGLY